MTRRVERVEVFAVGAARALHSVPQDGHTMWDAQTRAGRACPLPGRHLVLAAPAVEVLTCQNVLPLRRRPRQVFSPMCKAQLVMDEDGSLPAVCPRCGSAVTI